MRVAGSVIPIESGQKTSATDTKGFEGVYQEAGIKGE
jgi:hypothetical protein